MSSCAVVGCSSRTDRNKSRTQDGTKITFHRFPRNAELRIQWIKAINREKDWLPSDRSLVCSVHFSEDCFNRTLDVVRLRPDKVPTIFPPLISVQQKLSKTRPQLKRNSASDIEVITTLPSSDVSFQVAEPQPSSSGVRSGNIGEPPAHDLWNTRESRSTSSSPDRKHRPEAPSLPKLRVSVTSEVAQLRKKVKGLQQITRRQRKKISTISNVLRSLKERNLLQEKTILILSNM